MLYLAFILGLTASIHCIVMCGPIAVSLPVHQRSLSGKWTGILVYNAGRLLSYGSLGMIAGLLGYAFEITGWQKAFSIAVGLLMISVVVYSSGTFEKLGSPLFFRSGIRALKQYWKHFLSKKDNISLAVIGVLNGILPCGMVYVALLSAASMQRVEQSVVYMLLYGLGTLPTMIAMGMGGHLIPSRYRVRLGKLTPWVIAITGFVLIMRGLENPFSLQHGSAVPICGQK